MSEATRFSRTAGRQVKRAIAAGLELSGIVRRSRADRQQELAVLMYHGVVHDLRGPAAYGDLFVSARDFARHLDHLKRYYHPVSLAAIVDALATSTPFPARAVAVTIDDGYENTLKVALPLLAEAGVPATVFVSTDLIGTPRYFWFDGLRLLVHRAWESQTAFDLGSGIQVPAASPSRQETQWMSLCGRILDLPLLARTAVQGGIDRLIEREGVLGRFPEFALTTWDDLRAAVAGGILSVGSHAVAHEDLSALTLPEQTAILRVSRERIEQELGLACTTIAYPYGRWNRDSPIAARDAGYRCGMTVEPGFNAVTDNAFGLKRIMVGDKGDLTILSSRLSGSWQRLKFR
ncbi:MAG TPA: polysaccharide deacetylase family protein [Vicinamibacterales bacterium]|nr:polysaccharide deacetylase family protein [Vicinamibacterales bacterium]